MTTSRPRRPRARTTPAAAAAQLERVKAARDELDARSADQQRQEDTLIAAYLAAEHDKTTAIAARDARVAELQQHIATLNQETEQELAAAEQRARAALAGLSKTRSAPQLSTMLDLKVKQIRARLRAHNNPGNPTPPDYRAPQNGTTVRTADGTTEKPDRPPCPAPGDAAASPARATAPAPVTATEPEPASAPDHPPADARSGSPAHAETPPPRDDPDRLF